MDQHAEPTPSAPTKSGSDDTLSRLSTFVAFAGLAVKYFSGSSGVRADEFSRLAAKALQEGNFALAERSARKATQLSPRDAQLQVSLGDILYERGKVAEAQACFEQALELDDTADEALIGMAVSLHAQGMVSDAVYYYLKYLEREPESLVAMVNLAAALQFTGQPSEAKAMFERACDQYPENPLVHGLYGRALYDLGEFDDAILRLRTAIDLGSRESEVYRALAMALEVRGDLDGAQTQLRHAVELDQGNAAAHLELAALLADEIDPGQAVVHAQTAVELVKKRQASNAELSSGLWQLGWALYKTGDWRRSAQMSREALNNDPHQLPVKFNLGLALLRAGESEEAFREYREAADAVEDALDLRIYGIDDLKAALDEDPDLSGGAEILELLERRYKTLVVAREEPSPA